MDPVRGRREGRDRQTDRRRETDRQRQTDRQRERERDMGVAFVVLLFIYLRVYLIYPRPPAH